MKKGRREGEGEQRENEPYLPTNGLDSSSCGGGGGIDH